MADASCVLGFDGLIQGGFREGVGCTRDVRFHAARYYGCYLDAGVMRIRNGNGMVSFRGPLIWLWFDAIIFFFRWAQGWLSG